MSSLAFLVTELQSLASETRRKHPEIREAAEKSLAILRASPEQATKNLASDGPQSDDLLRPVFMGCATKNAKVVAISLGSLQRLIALKAVPHSAVPLMISTMSDAMSQGVDIQLRILQTLVSLIPNFPAIHGPLLGDALLLCFKLQESKIAVVSSTAAATLRQLVMFVVDKMVVEDGMEELDGRSMSEIKLPDGTTKLLGPSTLDAFSVFEDLCLLANSERPHFLKLESLHKTFALELIESVLTNYHTHFRKHPELILLLQHHLCPLLLKALSDRPVFPLTLRCTRVVFLLLKQFSAELTTESEVFLMLLIKIFSDDGDGDHAPHHARPLWMKVLAMEIMRGLCSDAELMRNVWDRYDAQDTGSKVFASLITALKRLITEKPALLGVCSQLSGLGVPNDTGSTYSLDSVGGMAGRVANAATATVSATVSGVVGMMGSIGGLSLHGSAMKLQCIDQLDKADSPPIPESYIYLLALQCLVSLCDGFASFTGPLYTAIVIQRPKAAGETVVRAPPALDLDCLPKDDPSAKQLRVVRDIIANGWPALLAALSFIISTDLSDELFVEVLASYQALTNVAGMLALTTPRDAFFTSFAKFAVPARVVSSLDSYVESQTPRSTASFSENLGLSAPAQAPGLSERNMACLKVLISSAVFLAGSLGESWFNVLEVLQNADYVLTSKAGAAGKRTSVPPSAPASRSVSLSASGSASGSVGQPRHPLLSDLEPETLLLAVQRLFDASKNLEDAAYKHFVNALCRLSAEMVEMQSGGGSGTMVESESHEDVASVVGLSPRTGPAHRRRVSGIHIPRTLRSGDFGITKLGGVSLLNIHRLIYRSPDVAWDATTSHLLSVIHTTYAPHSIRIQAASVLDEILVIVPRNVTTTSDLQAQVQRRVLDVLAQQVIPDPSALAGTTTSVELRRMGLETLHQILQASGHTLVVGWETIFQMLESVCRPSPPVRSPSVDSMSLLSTPPSPSSMRSKPLPLGLGNPSEKSYNALVKIAFQSLTLVCDSVTSLSPQHLRLCISTLGQFGRQADTNIALTAAASLLWSVSDAIQSKRKNADEEPEYSELWMFLLLEVLGLCTDPRQEVRDGAIQTLFRTMQLYGSTLSLETWDQCIWKVTFPLLDALTREIRHLSSTVPADQSVAQSWDESKILALHSIGSIFHDFLAPKIMQLDSFSKAWDVFVTLIQDSVLLDSRSISAPALRCLEKAVKVSPTLDLPPIVSEVLERVWKTIDVLGGAVIRRSGTQTPISADEPGFQRPFTQESLVAFVDVIQSMRKAGRSVEGREWSLDRLTRLMAILKGVLTYPNSPDFRPDIDALPPVQASVMETIEDIDLSVPGSPSLVLRDLSEYATLPFLAAFDVPPIPNTSTPPKRITYIAISKKILPILVDLFMRFKDSIDIYIDGTLEAVLSAYSIPVKLKYDCPAPSKFGKDLPLWKTATTSFLRIVKECAARINREEIPSERIEGLWHQVLDVFRGGILADCSAAESFPLDVQEAEENFDLALIAALEIDVAPHVGHDRVPDHLPISRSSSSTDLQSLQQVKKINVDERHELGSTEPRSLLPRERFSYWCFDLLFLICSNTTSEREHSRRRLAASSIPSLLNRCRTTLVGYVADESLRGNLPFPRAREHELLYVLRKLLELKLWPGSLWAALSETPTQYAVEQPTIDTSQSLSQLISDAVKRSPIAHLFHFYPVLCDIASIPRKTPTAWVVPARTPSSAEPAVNGHAADASAAWPENVDANAVELDARTLARACLKEIGKEMGVSQ
ncbi:putative C-terminal region of Mon2 protein [Lyophyllum shimeji]|uniref:C-terminal region of Mon2 protein n=1 Tax=Lyophyllum shimeji TaxID=47721 RepID=A0A9P3URZ1_LYOSH|nr:putative C-terminal region of Mon2 protein [Lyophyllum shimeji]